MSKKKFIKDKSFYTIKKHHVNTPGGTIYENDYMTIVQNDDILDEVLLYPNSKFKIKIRTDENKKKRHVKTPWLLNESGTSEWTKISLPNITEISEESKIVLKPNYSSLNDFAYFGSAVELIRATVNDIIKRFPGGLCYYEKDLAPKVKLDNTTYYFVSNECQIDCWSDGINNIKQDENPLRYLSYSYNMYVDKDEKNISAPQIKITGSCVDSIIGEVTVGSHKLYIYKDGDGINHLLTKDSSKKGIIIKPKDEYVKKFWNNLDDFERILLNKDSEPLYTAKFNTPYQDETGYYYTPKYYTWPTIKGTPFLDLSSYNYNIYINSLIELASFHDEYDSDNMWRMMTHESIKNLDRTFGINEDDDVDFGRMEAIVHIQGRQFDDLKRYADGIKSINTVSYDEQNNTPDYFLSDIIESRGWDGKNVCQTTELLVSGITIGINSANTSVVITSGKTSSFVNSRFLRTLALSSDYLQTMKGTKRGIETMLGLFGFNVNGVNPEVVITEYYAEVEDLLSYDDFVCNRAAFEYINEGENTNFLRNYPLALYEFQNEKQGYPDAKIGPWYDHYEKYEGDFYYQCKGGWGKTKNRFVNRPDLTPVSSITGDYIYKETEPYMLFANDLNELVSFPNDKIKDGIICYVSDIRDIEEKYMSGATEQMTDFSHYFILRNTVLSTHLGYVDNDLYKCYGWYNIKISKIDNLEPSVDGEKVIYLETLIPEFNGNNPHIGKGDYDFGFSYLDKYKQLFKTPIEEGRCEDLEIDEYNKIENFGFKLSISGTTSGKCFEYVLSENEETNNNNDNEDIKRINLKNITIQFNFDDNEIKKYIIDTVIPYVEMMLPSTVIVEYLFKGETSYINEYK